MKIGVDFDGVILDTETNLKYYADYFSYFDLKDKKERTRNDLISQEDCYNWTNEEVNLFYKKYFFKASEESNLKVGASQILKKLKDDGHKLYVISLRGYYDDSEITTGIKKLSLLGVEFEKVIWKETNKPQVCKELDIDVMIEDNPLNIEKFVESGVKVLYLKDGYMKEVNNKNVIKVETWADIYRKINELKIEE